MGKGPHPRSGKSSRPYRGGHTGRGGSHEGKGCAVVALAMLGGAVTVLYGAAEAVTALF